MKPNIFTEQSDHCSQSLAELPSHDVNIATTWRPVRKSTIMSLFCSENVARRLREAKIFRDRRRFFLFGNVRVNCSPCALGFTLQITFIIIYSKAIIVSDWSKSAG